MRPLYSVTIGILMSVIFSCDGIVEQDQTTLNDIIIETGGKGYSLIGDWTMKAIIADEEAHIDTSFFSYNHLTLRKFEIDKDTTLTILTLGESSKFDFCSLVSVDKPTVTIINGKKNIEQFRIVEICLSQYDSKTWRYDCFDSTITFYLEGLSTEGTGLNESDFEKMNLKEKKIVFRVVKIDEENLILSKLHEEIK